MDKDVYPKDCIEKSKTDLEYFMQLQNTPRSYGKGSSVELWNRRAEAWETDYRDAKKRKSDDRVESTVLYLQNRGVLDGSCDVADIGCGPGRFVAAFARTARYVLGIDISPKMIQYGSEYAKREGLKNVSFRVCDFQKLHIEKENLDGMFDLVFGSITPAVHGMDGLNKFMKMSRKYCCNITHIHSENGLESRIMKEVFGRKRPVCWAGPWFYSLFNVLFLTGYYPEATYYKRYKKYKFKPDSERVQLFMEQMLEPHERNDESAALIRAWMQSNADDDGLVQEISEVWFGRLLWDVHNRTERVMRNKSGEKQQM